MKLLTFLRKNNVSEDRRDGNLTYGILIGGSQKIDSLALESSWTDKEEREMRIDTLRELFLSVRTLVNDALLDLELMRHE